MSKERRTVTLDPDVDQYLDEEGVNASQLINHLVENHFTLGGDEIGMLRLREQQLESDITELESRLSSKRKELEQVQYRLDEHRDDQDSVLLEAAETLPPDVRTPDNPAVETWAKKANLPVSEFLDRLEEVDRTT